MRVYVAGPYSADNVITVLDNIQKGIRLATEIFLLGHSPFTPWLDFHFHLMLRESETLTVSDYYRYSLDWLLVSEAMIVVEGYETSLETLNEIAIAKEQGIPVYYSLDKFTERE